jgi:hypothetical protein
VTVPKKKTAPPALTTQPIKLWMDAGEVWHAELIQPIKIRQGQGASAGVAIRDLREALSEWCDRLDDVT